MHHHPGYLFILSTNQSSWNPCCARAYRPSSPCEPSSTFLPFHPSRAYRQNLPGPIGRPCFCDRRRVLDQVIVDGLASALGCARNFDWIFQRLFRLHGCLACCLCCWICQRDHRGNLLCHGSCRSNDLLSPIGSYASDWNVPCYCWILLCPWNFYVHVNANDCENTTWKESKCLFAILLNIKWRQTLNTSENENIYDDSCSIDDDDAVI